MSESTRIGKPMPETLGAVIAGVVLGTLSMRTRSIWGGALIHIAVAITMGVDARPFVVAIMFGSSASFSTPIGYQTNTFVYGAGGYKFGDFFKAGFPLAVVMWLIASFLIPVIWPFYP